MNENMQPVHPTMPFEGQQPQSNGNVQGQPQFVDTGGTTVVNPNVNPYVQPMSQQTQQVQGGVQTMTAPPQTNIPYATNVSVDETGMATGMMAPIELLKPNQTRGVLTPAEQEKARAIANQIDITDQRSLMSYGVKAQQKLETAADRVLGSATGQDNEEIAMMITNLMATVNEVTPDDITKARKKGLFPWVRKKAEQRMLELKVKSQKIEGSISVFAGQLSAQQDKLINNNVLLQQQLEGLESYFKELYVEIAAGDMKIEEIDNVILPDLMKKRQETNDPLIGQKIMQVQQARSDISSHIDSLMRSQHLALYQCGQISVLQQGNSELAKKLQDAVSQVVPLWKSQMSLSLMLLGAENALKTLDVVTDTTNKLIVKTAEQVKDTGTEIARKSKAATIKMESLRSVHRDLVDTIKGITEVTKEAEAKRVQAQAEMRKNEDELIAMLNGDTMNNLYIAK